MQEEKNIIAKLAEVLESKVNNVTDTVKLIDEGNTVPFIARYRKEVTGGMSDEKLRELFEMLTFYRNFEKRKKDILRLLEEQGNLTSELEEKLAKAQTLAGLEDIYRPYRPKRRTRATVAQEKGLKPLAEAILAGERQLKEKADEFIDEEKQVATAEDALQGARDIVAEIIADDYRVRGVLRDLMQKEGIIASHAKKGFDDSTYEMYTDFQEPCRKIQPHRILALNRGEKEEQLQVKIEFSEEKAGNIIEKYYLKGDHCQEACSQLIESIDNCWKRLLLPSLEREVRGLLTEKAEEQALKIFKDNLKNLLLTPPVKEKRLLGIDPGLRTGCKVACVDETGKLLETEVIFPTPPRNEEEKAAGTLEKLIKRHKINAIVIGNGTGSRETEEFVAEMMAEKNMDIAYTIVNEAGASVYSASKLAQEEFPHLDVAERSAVSIARRLQDPLAELVKIDPRSIGVGQYQHDINQKKLKEALDGVVEGCVNLVGVDLNTASASLLSYIAGINKTVALNIVTFRDENGSFASRQELKKVAKLGPAAFKQCAGFLRIPDAEIFFDRSAVHPESYGIAQKIMDALNITFEHLGDQDAIPEADLDTLSARLDTGKPTIKDIIEEFKRPGRDPREGLPEPIFKEGVMDIKDLKEGMLLKGVVRNVVDFGAFIDIGVHQDGLAHISELADKFIKHPSQVVKVGDVINVTVLSVDEKRKRISLTLKN